MSVGAAFVGTFHWIPAVENGPTIPFGRPKMSAFAYVEPQRDNEGALLVEGVPAQEEDAAVRARWIVGYPTPHTNVGDVVTVLAGQRPIATITVTETGEAH